MGKCIRLCEKGGDSGSSQSQAQTGDFNGLSDSAEKGDFHENYQQKQSQEVQR